MLGVSGTPVLDAVGKLGDLGDRSSDKRTLLLRYGLMIRLADRSDWYVTIHSAIRYDLMGIMSCGESPWGWAPTIRFRMAVDAIDVMSTTYLPDVRYYLANLGTALESQVTS